MASSPSETASSSHERARMHLGTLKEGSEKSATRFAHLKRSSLAPFFGSNVVEPVAPLAPQHGEHPCAAYSRQVHHCLDTHENSFNFCQSAVFAFNKCLNELDPV